MTTTTMDLIPVYVTCISITLTLAESDTFENQRIMAGGYIYPDRLGLLQCKRLCYRYGGCGAVSYLKEHCVCELHGLNSRQSDMSGHRGSVTWIKNAADKESCRESRSFCQEEEQCLFTGRGEFKCVPAKIYFATEMRLKSKRIPSNVEVEYLESWGPSQEQMCEKHNDKYPRKENNIPLRNDKTYMYYILIHVSQNKTIFKPEKHLWRQGQNSFFRVLSVKYLFHELLKISMNKTCIGIGRDRSTFLPYPYTLNTELEMDVGMLFYPMKKKLSAFVLQLGNDKFTSFNYQKTHVDIALTLHESFCLMPPTTVAITTLLGMGISTKLLPFEESKQYMEIWENALNSLT